MHTLLEIQIVTDSIGNVFTYLNRKPGQRFIVRLLFAKRTESKQIERIFFCISLEES